MCYTDYTNPGYYASYLIPEIAWGSSPAQHFAHYYVLSGMKNRADSWTGGSFSTTEISLSVDFPEEHTVVSEWKEGTGKSDVAIEVIPEVSLVAPGLAEEDIPVAFMDASLKHILTDNKGKALFTGEFRPEGSESIWTSFEVEAVSPSADTRSVSGWKYIMKADGLMPDTRYEYRLSRLDGQTLVPENKMHYFTTDFGISVGIGESVISDIKDVVRVYDMTGRQLPGLVKGFNIVVDANGNAHKVLVR